MIKSRKSKLLIDISKEIVKQYRNQLENFIIEHKQYDEKKFFYRCHLKDAEKVLQQAEDNLIYINKILDNYEKCVFNGEVLDDRVIYYVPTYSGDYIQTETEIEPNKSIYTVPLPSNGPTQTSAKVIEEKTISKEPIEIEIVLNGIKNLFDYISIPESVTFPIILDVIDRLNANNYDSNHNLNKERLSANKFFDINGLYSIPEFRIGTRLEKHMYGDSFYVKHNSTDYMNEFELLDKSFVLDAIPVYNIIKDYINTEANIKFSSELNKENKNVIKKDILNFLFKKFNFRIYNLTKDKDDYYYDIFHHDYRAIDSNMIDDEIKNVGYENQQLSSKEMLIANLKEFVKNEKSKYDNNQENNDRHI